MKKEKKIYPAFTLAIILATRWTGNKLFFRVAPPLPTASSILLLAAIHLLSYQQIVARTT